MRRCGAVPKQVESSIQPEGLGISSDSGSSHDRIWPRKHDSVHECVALQSWQLVSLHHDLLLKVMT